MTNTKLLELYISNSGLKMNYIAERLGISDSIFRRKKNNKLNFKASEMYKLGNCLEFTTLILFSSLSNVTSLISLTWIWQFVCPLESSLTPGQQVPLYPHALP